MLTKLPKELKELVYDFLPARDRVRMNLALPKGERISKTHKTCPKNDKALGVMSTYLKKHPAKKIKLSPYVRSLLTKNLVVNPEHDDVKTIFDALEEDDKRSLQQGNSFTLEELLNEGKVTEETLRCLKMYNGSCLDRSIVFSPLVGKITPGCLDLLMKHPNTKDYFESRFLKDRHCLWSCVHFGNLDLLDHICDKYKNVCNEEQWVKAIIESDWYTLKSLKTVLERFHVPEEAKQKWLAQYIEEGKIEMASFLMCWCSKKV